MQIDTRGSRELGRRLERLDRQFPVVIARGLNDTARKGRTFAAKQIGATLNLKASTIKRDFYSSRATRNKLQSTLVAKGHGTPLARYKGTRQVKKGISVKVKTRGARQLLRHAFILTPKRGGAVIAIRAIRGGKRVARRPLDFPYGPSPSQYWRRQGARQTKVEARKNMARFLNTELKRNVTRVWASSP